MHDRLGAVKNQRYSDILVREALKKKRGLLMEIFHKGSDPPPLFSGVMEPVLHI